MRKIFFDDLPRNWKGIDWKNSIGYQVHFIYDEIEDNFEIIDYIKGNNYYNKIVIDYNGRITKLPIASISNNIGLDKIIGKRTEDFKYNIGDTFVDSNRDIIITQKERRKIITSKQIHNEKVYKYHCNICGWNNGWMSERQILNGKRCACCSNSVVVEGINDIPTTAPWMVDYFPGGYEEAKRYTKTSSKKIFLKCPECHRITKNKFQISYLYYNHSIGCICSDGYSKPAKYFFSVLSQLQLMNIISDFEIEKRYDWCIFYNPFKNKECYGIYDFVIEDFNLIIEIDGGFHRTDNNLSGESKEESIFKDNEKDKLAQKHGYKIIRISDYKDIKENIIRSQFGEIFDLSNIDWEKSLEDSCSNYVKRICDIKKQNPNFTTQNISDLTHFCKNTIITWLKVGNELGWCKYNSMDEWNKTKFGVKNNKSIWKKIICLENGIIFDSVNACSRKSKDVFGINISESFLSLVCNNKRKYARGYHFKFISDLTLEEYKNYDVENKLKELKAS